MKMREHYPAGLNRDIENKWTHQLSGSQGSAQHDKQLQFGANSQGKHPNVFASPAAVGGSQG